MVYFPRIGTAEYTVKVIETRLLQVPKFKCQRTPGQTVHASTKLTPTHAPISPPRTSIPDRQTGNAKGREGGIGK